MTAAEKGRTIAPANSPQSSATQKGTDGTTEYYYAHMDSIAAGLDAGDRVSAGQIIGTVGNTGRSTGPHLHYEVRYKNRPINPAKFVNINKLISLNSG